MPKLRRSQNRSKVVPLPLSIGGWCLVNLGQDPFGDAVRAPTLTDGLRSCRDAVITHVSFHDRDLYPDDATPEIIDEKVDQVLRLLENTGQQVLCFTTNLFSNPCFRSGAFSSPRPEVRQAAIVKGCRSVHAARRLGATNIIFWGGREGTEVFEQDCGEAVRNYMLGARAVIVYATAQGYQGTFTFEPKVYEPRFHSYAATGAAMGSAIREFFPEAELAARVKINPEYPQHVAMLGLNPAIELGQLIEEDLVGPCVHFGGQPPCRMDADFAPGLGGSPTDDFHVCKLLHDAGYRGFVEFDCRPLRTSASEHAMQLFARQCVAYWRQLEHKVALFRRDPIIRALQAEIFGQPIAQLDDVLAITAAGAETDSHDIIGAVNRLPFSSFAETAAIDTDAIEAFGYRVQQIVCGTHREGAAMFHGTRWAAAHTATAAKPVESVTEEASN
ncbi:MAG: hypothetical protein Q7S23_04355 [bacterium]|nr:hypothetical protein [bacterium]